MYFIRDYDGPKSYQIGTSPDILILGQDPTIDTSTRFDTVLGLALSESSSDRESLALQTYIFGRILAPLGIDKSRIVVTNLVNQYYHDVPNKIIAKTYLELIVATAKDKGIDISQYRDKDNGALLHALNFEAGTRKNFEDILNRFPIRHIITLGEPVFQVLRERYNLSLPERIKEVLEKLTNESDIVNIYGKRLSLLPLPHISSANRKFYKDFLDNKLKCLSAWYSRR